MRSFAAFCAQIVALFVFAVAGVFAGPRLVALHDRWFPPPAFIVGDYAALYAENAQRVVVFTSSTCPHCKRTREFLDSRHIAYADLVIDKSPAAQKRFDTLGESGVPVIFIGDRKIVGFRQDAIEDALKARG